MNDPIENKGSTKTAILAGAVIAFLIAIGHLYWQVDRMSTDIVTLRQSVVGELTKIRAAATSPAEATRKALAAEMHRLEALKKELEDELKSTRFAASAAAHDAKAEAVSHANRLARQLGDEQQHQHKEVAGEIGQVKQTTATASAKIDDMSADMVSIKNQVAATRYELEKTVSDLKRVTGDLGVQSGLIATNARELAVLKLLGERNYFDFHIQRSTRPQRVGDITVVLKRTDPKSHRYTMDIVAGDKRTEKRDKAINEPVQFYVARAKMPYELVVNEVQKDYVIGYLSTPKEQVVSQKF